MAMTKAQRTARAQKAARTRWDNASAEDKNRQKLTMVEAQARTLGYRLEPIDNDTQKEDWTMSADIIPAQPGYYLLNVTYTDEGGPNGFEKTPVIAWNVISNTAYPIGDAHSLTDAVMRTDGSVYISGENFGDGKEFANEAAALQYFTDAYRSLTDNT
jgi:hypothetical protein